MSLENAQKKLTIIQKDLKLYPDRLDLDYGLGDPYTIFKFKDGKIETKIKGIFSSKTMYDIREIIENEYLLSDIWGNFNTWRSTW